MSLELLVVRHGETIWNRERRIQGHKNTLLSKLGKQQAQTLASSFAEEAFERILSSDLKRCRVTAEIINLQHRKPLSYSKRLRERGFGKLEGLTWSEAKDRYPGLMSGVSSSIDADSWPELGIEHQERDFRARVLDGIRRIPTRYPGLQRLLLVTHGGVVKVLLAEAEGRGKIFMVPNCSLYRFQLELDESENAEAGFRLRLLQSQLSSSELPCI